jgi:hypothetical protein
MISHIKYTKADGDVSHRVIYPIGVLDTGKDNVKIQAIDLSSLTDKERTEAEIVLNAIRKSAWQAVYDAGFSDKIRSFFFKQIDYT